MNGQVSTSFLLPYPQLLGDLAGLKPGQNNRDRR